MNLNSIKRQRGQTLIEFALILPVMLFLVLVIFDLGRAVYYYSVLTNAAREGARYASVETAATTLNVQQHTLDYAVGVDLQITGITVNKAVVTTVTVGGATRTETNVTVNITYNFDPITPYVERLGGGSITINTTARMGREY